MVLSKCIVAGESSAILANKVLVTFSQKATKLIALRSAKNRADITGKLDTNSLTIVFFQKKIGHFPPIHESGFIFQYWEIK